MKQRFAFLILAAALSLASVSSMAALRVAGTDLFGQGVQSALAAELQSAGIEAEFDMQGSLHAVSSLENGAADAILVAVADGSEPPAGRQYTFAFQVVTFGVHVSNPLTELTYGQLTSIFQDGGNLTNWVDLVSELAWQDRKISLMAAQADSNISLQIFNALVLKGSSLKDTLRVVPANTDQARRQIEEDASVIFLLPAMDLGTSGKLLAVAPSANGAAFTPSQDNVFYGDYPLRLPFMLVVSGDVAGDMAATLVRSVLSESVTKALLDEGYMVIPQPERAAILGSLE